MPEVTRDDVLRFRFRRHQLDRSPGTAAGPAHADLLDYGVQDTGPDGAAWALAIRGVPPDDGNDLAFAWTLRGAPHAYRRADLAAVATATAPYSEADAAKRIFDAAKPLNAAGIPVLDALRVVAGHLRDIVERPTVKGDTSGRLTELVDEPFRRFCRPCDTIHVYEQPFRLSALQAGLELEPRTSPPVMRRVPHLRPPMFEHLAGEADARVDVVRNYLRFYGPARVRDATAFIDAAAKDVKAHWPVDAVDVEIDGETRTVLESDVDALAAGSDGSGDSAVRLLGPFDPYLQLRDRELLVPDEARRKELWPVIGRPGAIAVGGELAGTWRPRTSGRKLTVSVVPWRGLNARQRAAVEEEAERLAAFRSVSLAGVSEG